MRSTTATARPPTRGCSRRRSTSWPTWALQPGTLQSGLVAATASTDHTAPTAVITSPASGASIANGAPVTVTGTASDVGGVVAGVEVSTDGGTTWHPATGTTSWTYTYFQSGLGASTIKVRATDDSGNYPSTPTSTPITVTGPASIFAGQQPATVDSGDPAAVELGLRFTAQQNGFISGVRFYKSTANTGTHTGSLWDASGTRLATVTFAGESASGWQSATFASAVPVSAGTKYVISYSAPAGHYAAQSYAFAYRGISDNVFSVAGGFGAEPAGVYATSPGAFPQTAFGNADYYVDALFSNIDNSPLTATGQSPLPGSSSVPLSTTIGAVMSKPVDPASIAFTVKNSAGTAVPGGLSYAATTRTATFTPSSALTNSMSYSVTMTAKDTTGAALSSGGTWSFVTVKPAPQAGVCPCGLFTDSTVPSTPQIQDAPVTLGVKFSSTASGSVTGIRFYKDAANTGTPRGNPLEHRRTAVGDRHLHQRVHRRLADPDLRDTGRHRGEHRLHRVVPVDHGKLLGDTGRLLRVGYQQPSAGGGDHLRRLLVRRRLPGLQFHRELPGGRRVHADRCSRDGALRVAGLGCRRCRPGQRRLDHPLEPDRERLLPGRLGGRHGSRGCGLAVR